MKKLLTLLTALMLILSAVLLSACGSSESATPDQASGDGTTDYTVTVKDAIGVPCKTAVVRFCQNGVQVAMQACNENGVAIKNLPNGEYTIELSFTDGDANYYYEAQTIQSGESTLEIMVSQVITTESVTLTVDNIDYLAYDVVVGSTYAELESGKLNYFIFTPTVAGNYKFSVINNQDAKIGYYGAPHYIQSISAAEVKDNAFTISVSASMIGSDNGGTSKFVIGVESTNGTTDCILAIERIGDPIKTIEDEPWEVYKTTTPPEAYTLPENAEIKEFDLTAQTSTYNLVLNEADGFYHLNSADGPIVLVRLTEDSDYIACFYNILDRSGVSRYFYDNDGNFTKKVSYDKCLLEYIDCADETEGVYPLTEDLKHIIQNRGEYVGWWNPQSSGYIFKDERGVNDLSINTEIAWLLMCCYAE